MSSITKLGVLLAAAVAAAAASAQDAPAPAPATAAQPAPGADRDARHREWEARRAEWQARRAERQAKRETDLALLLDLSSSQRERLHGYLAAMHPPRDGGRDREARQGNGTAPNMDQAGFGDRLATMQARLDRQTRDAQGRLTAARTFYASLDARQQQKFDAVRRLERPHGGPMHHREGGGPGPWGMHDMARPGPSPAERQGD